MHIEKNKGRTENRIYTHIGKDKGRSLPIFIEGKIREELKNISHIHIGKDKRRTEK